MQTVEYSVLSDLSSFVPTFRGAEFICEACPCGSLSLYAQGKTIVCECPHIVQVLADGEVVEVQSLGNRH